MIVTRRTTLMGFGACLLTIAVSACGVPADSKPREIPRNQVPFDLLATSTTTTNTTQPVSTVRTNVYMIGSDRLVAVQRSVAEPPLGYALGNVAQGPTAQEESNGLRSAINSNTRVLSAKIENNVAVINLSDSFADISLQDQILGLAQLVFTATELPGVDSVQVSLNGKQAQVPRGDGSATSGLLTRADYSNVAPQ